MVHAVSRVLDDMVFMVHLVDVTLYSIGFNLWFVLFLHLTQHEHEC